MSFLVNKLAEHVADKIEDKIKSALGVGDDEDKKEKDDKDGGFLSIFKKDKDEKDEEDEKDKGGLFSFGKDKGRDKDEDKGNFFTKVFNRDDDDDDDRERVPKKSGFSGLFSEQPGAEGSVKGPAEGGGPCDHMTEDDLDLMSDLMEVAKEGS